MGQQQGQQIQTINNINLNNNLINLNNISNNTINLNSNYQQQINQQLSQQQFTQNYQRQFFNLQPGQPLPGIFLRIFSIFSFIKFFIFF